MNARTLQLYSTPTNPHDGDRTGVSTPHRLEPLYEDLVNGPCAAAYFYAGDYGSALSFIRRTIQLQLQFSDVVTPRFRGPVAKRMQLGEAVTAPTRGVEVSSGSPFLCC